MFEFFLKITFFTIFPQLLPQFWGLFQNTEKNRKSIKKQKLNVFFLSFWCFSWQKQIFVIFTKSSNETRSIAFEDFLHAQQSRFSISFISVVSSLLFHWLLVSYSHPSTFWLKRTLTNVTSFPQSDHLMLEMIVSHDFDDWFISIIKWKWLTIILAVSVITHFNESIVDMWIISSIFKHMFCSFLFHFWILSTFFLLQTMTQSSIFQSKLKNYWMRLPIIVKVAFTSK